MGHSNVPDDFQSYGDVEVLVYKRGGAKIHHILEDEYLKESLDNEVDLTVAARDYY